MALVNSSGDENIAGSFGLVKMPKFLLNGKARSGGSAGARTRYTIGLLIAKTFGMLEYEVAFAGGFRNVNSQGSVAIVEGQFVNDEGQERPTKAPMPSGRQNSKTRVPRICMTCKHFMTGLGQFESAVHVTIQGKPLSSEECHVSIADHKPESENAWAYLTRRERKTLRKHNWDMWTYNAALPALD